jgi:hypothetical protein
MLRGQSLTQTMRGDGVRGTLPSRIENAANEESGHWDCRNEKSSAPNQPRPFWRLVTTQLTTTFLEQPEEIAWQAARNVVV